MAFYGADVDALTALSRQMNAAAELLENTRPAIGSLLSSVPWQGDDAEIFRYEWNGPHATRLAAAASALRDAASALLNNANQQRQASEVDGSPGSLSSDIRAEIGTAWGDLRRLTDSAPWQAMNHLLAIPGLADALTAAAAAGESWLAWANAPWLQDIAKLTKTPAVAVGGYILGGISIFEDGVKVIGDVQRGQWADAGYTAADALSIGLKSFKATPVTYLAGVDVALWSDVAQAATKIDWSQLWNQGLPNPLSGNNLTTMWLPALGDSIGQAGIDAFKAVF